MKVDGSSDSVGPVEEGRSIMITFEVFFCRIWYVFAPLLKRA